MHDPSYAIVTIYNVTICMFFLILLFCPVPISTQAFSTASENNTFNEYCLLQNLMQGTSFVSFIYLQQNFRNHLKLYFVSRTVSHNSISSAFSTSGYNMMTWWQTVLCTCSLFLFIFGSCHWNRKWTDWGRGLQRDLQRRDVPGQGWGNLRWRRISSACSFVCICLLFKDFPADISLYKSISFNPFLLKIKSFIKYHLCCLIIVTLLMEIYL